MSRWERGKSNTPAELAQCRTWNTTPSRVRDSIISLKQPNCRMVKASPAAPSSDTAKWVKMPSGRRPGRVQAAFTSWTVASSRLMSWNKKPRRLMPVSIFTWMFTVTPASTAKRERAWAYSVEYTHWEMRCFAKAAASSGGV